MPSLLRRSYKAILGALPGAPVRISPSSLDIHSRAEATPLVATTCNSAPVDDLHSRPPTVDSRLLLQDVDHHTAASPDSSSLSSLSFDVNKFLNIIQEMAHLNDIQGRALILNRLCSLCSDTETYTIDQCCAIECVEVILNLLNDSMHESHHERRLTAPIMVKQTERALLLLQLMTAKSDSTCAAALQESSLILNNLGKILLRVSESCTVSTIAILVTLCGHSNGGPFCEAISETAIPSKLVVVLQVATEDSTKRSAGKLLQLLDRQRRARGTVLSQS